MSMTRTQILNALITKYNFKSYLEIGVYNKDFNYNHIQCNNKLCIDPDPNAQADLVMTSDEFFSRSNLKFDIVFVDGMHEAHQVYKDIKNALVHLNKNGIIMCHDCNPTSELAAGDWEEFSKCKFGDYCWNGDCWKGFVKYRFESDYHCYVLESDLGCGIINTSEKTTLTEKHEYHIGELTYKDLNNNRKYLLDLQQSII